MFKCCSHGTLLHFGLQSSHLNTCYYHQDLHLWQLDPGPRPKLQRIPQRPSYSTKFDMIIYISTLPVQHRFTTLQRHPFSGLVDSAGELLHTPWRFPTSMATVLLSLSTNTFNGIRWALAFGTLAERLDHPTAPVLLTKNGPLGTRTFTITTTPVKWVAFQAHSKFENRLRSLCPQCL